MRAIPQEIINAAFEACRELVIVDSEDDISDGRAVLDRTKLTKAIMRAHKAIDELDALEQPPDPASVASREWSECNGASCEGWDDPHGRSMETASARSHLSWHIRQAHAEREEAVRELVNYHCYIHGTELSGFCGHCKAITVVRKLFGFDKEKS